MTTALKNLRDLGFFAEHGIPDDCSDTADPRVVRAIREYQLANIDDIDALIAKHHPGRNMAIADGVVGPATTEALANHKWCATMGHAAHETGQPWGPCHEEGIYFSVDYNGDLGLAMPAWLEDIWPEVLSNMIESGRTTGRRFIETDWNHPVQVENIRVSFVSHTPGWIGLAEYPYRYDTCAIQLFCRLNLRYRPSSNRERLIDQWTRLFCHEIGHNSALEHHTEARSGLMYPVIYSGDWEGIPQSDPCYTTLMGYYGGELPDEPDPEPEPGWQDVNLDSSYDWRRVRVNIADEPMSPFILTQMPSG